VLKPQKLKIWGENTTFKIDKKFKSLYLENYESDKEEFLHGVPIMNGPNISGLDKDICTNFDRKMQQGHTEIITRPKGEPEVVSRDVTSRTLETKVCISY